jgi:hypothetical protein
MSQPISLVTPGPYLMLDVSIEKAVSRFILFTSFKRELSSATVSGIDTKDLFDPEQTGLLSWIIITDIIHHQKV